MLHFLRKNWFLFGLVCVLALAVGLPNAVRAVAFGNVTASVAVMIVFFISGLTLPSGAARDGVRRVRVHLFVQLFLFVVTPLFFLATAAPLRHVWGAELHAGIMALAVLPTTISSCVVFTQMAAGHTAVVLFNTVLANLAGVVLSPLILAALLRHADISLSGDQIWRVFLSLMVKVLAPFVAGQAARMLLAEWAGRHRRKLSTVSSVLLLVIIALAVARGVAPLREALGGAALPACFGYLVVAHMLLVLLAMAGVKLMRFERSCAVAAFFAASQKTLALGVPLITTAFPDSGLALLPLLFYHPLMLFTAGLVLHTPFARPPEEDESP